MPALDETGEEGFLVGLRRCGCNPQKRDGVIVFSVVPIDGSRAGESIETGVEVEELAAWPSAPPHWVHLPTSMTFDHSNTRPSPIPDWLKHSRSVSNWGNAKEPAQAWIAHVRAVLEEA